MIDLGLGLLTGFWNYVVVFLIILTVVVFVHELGHFLVARFNGVRVEVFSIGFGKELFGYTARSGTRWRISLLPFGGYVRMFGESDGITAPDGQERPLTPEERAASFKHKRVGQRAAIVAAGPFANFAFGIIVLAILFMTVGKPLTSPVIGEVRPGSAAEEAGLLTGDRVLRIDGEAVDSFQDIQHIVRLRIGEELSMEVEREGRDVTVVARPRVTELKDNFGNIQRLPVLGVGASAESTEIVRYGPVTGLWAAVKETWTIVSATFTALGQMVQGTRDAEELGGPLRIAKGAGQAAQVGLLMVVGYTVILSINLGLINLFPIPLLDGGHLAYYAIEAAMGRPLGDRAQEYGFRIGLFLVFALMVFATRNDLVDFRVWEFFKGFFS